MKLVTFAGLVGGYFVVWKLAQAYKNNAHRRRLEEDLARGPSAFTDNITQLQYEKEKYAARGGDRVLNLSAFSTDALDVSDQIALSHQGMLSRAALPR